MTTVAAAAAFGAMFAISPVTTSTADAATPNSNCSVRVYDGTLDFNLAGKVDSTGAGCNPTSTVISGTGLPTPQQVQNILQFFSDVGLGPVPCDQEFFAIILFVSSSCPN